MLAGLRRLLSFLDPSLRRQWVGLVPLSVLTAAMEAAGAAAVYGLIRVVADPESLRELPVLSRLAGEGHVVEDGAIVALTALLALFYIAKNALLALVVVRRNRVAGRSMAALAERLFSAYLAAPYALHLRRNSAELVRNATASCEAAFESVMIPMVVVATEGLVIGGIVAVLVATAPIVTLISMVLLFGSLAAVLRFTQRQLEVWGRRAETQKAEAIRSVQESLGGLKELKVMGRGRFFADHFRKLQADLAALRSRSMSLVAAPPLVIETVFVCSMLVVVGLLVSSQGLGPDVIPLLGLYAYAGFRVIPSLHRILMNLNFARFGAAAVENLSRDLDLFEGQGPRPPPRSEAAVAGRGGTRGEEDAEVLGFAARVELDDVSYCYEGSPSAALEEVRLGIARGESLGVVGRTGSGKSTLVDVLLGLLTPTRGRVLVDGVDIREALPAWHRKIGYVPQDVYLMDETLRRNVALGYADAAIDDAKVARALAMAQLENFVATLPGGLDTRVGERGVRLSGGQKQRVAIARALYHEPELLVFDEATSSLDPGTEREVTSAIESLRGVKTLVVVTHRIAAVRSCDRLAFLAGGRLVATGSYQALAESSPDFRDMAQHGRGDYRNGDRPGTRAE